MQSNVKGVLQKKKLVVKNGSYIQEQALEFYPLTAAENKQQCWAQCIRALIAVTTNSPIIHPRQVSCNHRRPSISL